MTASTRHSTPGVASPAKSHDYERKLMGYVGGEDDTPEWYATCSCGWRGPSREDVGKPFEDHWHHLYDVGCLEPS